MRELKNRRWRRCRNPVPKHWPGPWIEWRFDNLEGKCWLGQVRDYLGISRGVEVESAIGAGKRAGHL